MAEEESHGVPEWVVTYGDMMSLLLTFFIMLVSLSDVVAEEKYRAVLDAIHKYVGYRQGPSAPPGKNFPLNALIKQLDVFSLGSFSDEAEGYGGIKTRSVEGKHVHVYRTPEGTPRQVRNAVAFDRGSAALTESAKNRLRKIASELAGKPNKIEIRGHVAPGPTLDKSESGGSDTGGSFVLSYQRALNALHFLEQLGIAHKRMRITAASDTEPLPKTGDRRSQQDDRVEVRMLDTFADDYVGPRELAD